MNGNDWQSYLDGSLTQEEMERLADLLRKDSQSQAELRGLETFLHELKVRAITDEPVPLSRMKQRLASSLPIRPVHRRVGWSIAAVAACVACFATIMYLRRDPVLSSFGGREVSMRASSSEAARNWLVQEVNLPVPLLNSTKFSLQVVRRGPDWAAFDVLVGENACSVYLKRSPETYAALPHVTHAGLSYIRGQGVGWRQDDTLYYVISDDERAMWTVAEEVRRLAVAQRPASPSGKTYNLPPSPHDHRPR